MTDNSCPICFDIISIESLSLKKNEKKMTDLDCKHKFHTDCIEEWIKKSNTCPICRAPISIKKELPVIIDIPVQENTIIRQQQTPNRNFNITIYYKKNPHIMLIVSLILFVLSIINFGYFYGISHQYINNFKDNINITDTSNCSILIDNIVLDCPKLKMLDLTIMIIGLIIYCFWFIYGMMIYNTNKTINIISVLIINVVCGVCIPLYYIITLLTQFNHINIYYISNPLFNSTMERNFNIAVILFYGCFILYNITHFKKINTNC